MSVITAPDPTPTICIRGDDIDKMIAYIEEHGWVQGRAFSPDGSVCVVGALLRVVPAPRSHPTLNLISRAIGYDVVHWNDTPGRTKAEVLDTLRGIRDHVDEF